jgi:hypothetical protein
LDRKQHTVNSRRRSAKKAARSDRG